MKTLTRILHISLSLQLAISPALAQIPAELEQIVFTGDVKARGSADNFRASHEKNVVGTIPAGSRGKVLETRKLPSGAYGIQIEMQYPAAKKGDRSVVKEGDKVWVYYSQKDPWLAFKDREGIDTQDPESALNASAIRDGQGMVVDAPKKALPKKEQVLKESKKVEPASNSSVPMTAALASTPIHPTPQQIEAQLCKENCDQSRDTQPAIRNRSNLKDIADSVQATTASPDDPWADVPRASQYSQSTGVKNMINHAMRNKASRSKRLCYRYVKRAMLAGDIVDSYPPGGHARDAMKDLKAQGMVNMLDNPEWAKRIQGPKDAPKGAVLVYLNKNRRKSGHIEIKTDHGEKGSYVSDFSQNFPILGNADAGRASRRYELVGVFIK